MSESKATMRCGGWARCFQYRGGFPCTARGTDGSWVPASFSRWTLSESRAQRGTEALKGVVGKRLTYRATGSRAEA